MIRVAFGAKTVFIVYLLLSTFVLIVKFEIEGHTLHEND